MVARAGPFALRSTRMKRRDLLTSLAIGATQLEAQPQARESLYIPKPHLVDDRSGWQRHQ